MATGDGKNTVLHTRHFAKSSHVYCFLCTARSTSTDPIIAALSLANPNPVHHTKLYTHLYLSLYTTVMDWATIHRGYTHFAKNFSDKKTPERGHSTGGTNQNCLKLRNQGLHFEKQLFNCKAYYTPSLFPVNFFCVNIH